MTTNYPKCTDEKHLYQARFICEHEGCESLLCLACFQTHKQDTGCEGIFGIHIKEVDGVFEETFETIPSNNPMKRKEKIIQEHDEKRTRILGRIQKTLQKEREIHQENGEKLDIFDSGLIEYLQNRSSQCKKEQVNVLRKRSESFGTEIFSRLENIRETLDTMEFDENNFSMNSQTIKRLNRQIAIEAEELIGLAEKAMDSWRLNKDRLEDYSNTLIKVIDGVEFSSLLNNEKLVYKISNFAELSEDLGQLNEEVKTLKNENGVLKSWISKLQTENNELKKEDFEGKITQLQQEIQALKNENTNLTTAKDELTQEKIDLSDAKEELENERDGLKATIETLKKENDDLIEARDELTQAKADLSDSKEELENERDGLKGKVEVLTKENEDLVTVRDGLIQEKEGLNEAKEKLENERDGLKGEIGTLKQEKADLTDARDQLTREKTELMKKNQELEEKSSSE